MKKGRRKSRRRNHTQMVICTCFQTGRVHHQMLAAGLSSAGIPAFAGAGIPQLRKQKLHTASTMSDVQEQMPPIVHRNSQTRGNAAHNAPVLSAAVPRPRWRLGQEWMQCQWGSVCPLCTSAGQGRGSVKNTIAVEGVKWRMT